MSTQSKPFLPVTVYSNWCYIDQLDGKHLVDGERIMVKWPDGTVHAATVSVKKWTSEGSDMGTRCDIPQSEAYITVPIHGAHASVRLLDSGCICRRIPTEPK